MPEPTIALPVRVTKISKDRGHYFCDARDADGVLTFSTIALSPEQAESRAACIVAALNDREEMVKALETIQQITNGPAGNGPLSKIIVCANKAAADALNNTTPHPKP